jgi:hypothetical protein
LAWNCEFWQTLFLETPLRDKKGQKRREEAFQGGWQIDGKLDSADDLSMNFRQYYSSLVLPTTAVFAFLWAVTRACVQSITIDEADTYLLFVAPSGPYHWGASSNNHVLNSLLMRLFTSVFGVSHLSVRAPALLGTTRCGTAAIYIVATYLICRKLTPMLHLQWPVFVCLVYNPFIFDYLVAARGYALALGFLMCMFAVAAYGRLDITACGLCSACAALSVAANFSFAFVCAFSMLAILVWACKRTMGTRARAQLVIACVLPGLLVSVFLTMPVVLNWSKGQMSYGAHSLAEMFTTVADSSLCRLNSQIVNPMLYRPLEALQPWLLPVVLALSAWQWVRYRPSVSTALLTVLIATIGAHWLLFKFFHVPLPMERTAIWIVPLCVLSIGATAEKRRALTMMVYVMSFYFLLSLRLDYFREWSWDQDVNKIYPLLAWYNHTYGVREVATNWRFVAALNFYRAQSGGESLEEFQAVAHIPTDRPVYVLYWEQDEELIRQLHLRVVYRSPNTQAVVAVRPEAEADWGPGAKTDIPTRFR